jgi:hypothetical protein
VEKQFPRIERLPPYVFNIVNDLKAAAAARCAGIVFPRGEVSGRARAGGAQARKYNAAMGAWAWAEHAASSRHIP